MKTVLRKIYYQFQRVLYKKKINPEYNFHSVGEIFVFIRSYNRPLYLWSCLDNLYRNTRSSCKFILIDNASTDPLVKSVIRGFERRGMFHAVYFMDENKGSNQEKIFNKHRHELGKYFFLLDADILIEKMQGCWVATMIDIAERQEQMGLLGSYIETSDFISLDLAREIAPQMNLEDLKSLIKADSVERNIPPKKSEIVNPFLPAGRLLLVRTKAINEDGLPIGNKNLCKVIAAKGYTYATSTSVVHRHLSLLNIYDYPDYDLHQLSNYLKGK